jgi:hypothetical protein
VFGVGTQATHLPYWSFILKAQQLLNNSWLISLNDIELGADGRVMFYFYLL